MEGEKYTAILELIKDGEVVGLGTGRAASNFVRELGQRVSKGLAIRGVPTSSGTEALARSLGIPIAPSEAISAIDIAVDGADEVDPNLNLIKGYGGALVREKIVATAATQFIVLVGPEKLVDKLGARGKLPVEVVRFGYTLAQQRLEMIGLKAELRVQGSLPFVSDNGNYILDCFVQGIDDPDWLDREIREIPGVVGTGLFIDIAEIVFVARGSELEAKRR
jgi:ribose 5-phosphate isomerase A